MTIKIMARTTSIGRNCQKTRQTRSREQLMSHTFCRNMSMLMGSNTSTADKIKEVLLSDIDMKKKTIIDAM